MIATEVMAPRPNPVAKRAAAIAPTPVTSALTTEAAEKSTTDPAMTRRRAHLVGEPAAEDRAGRHTGEAQGGDERDVVDGEEVRPADGGRGERERVQVGEVEEEHGADSEQHPPVQGTVPGAAERGEQGMRIAHARPPGDRRLDSRWTGGLPGT